MLMYPKDSKDCVLVSQAQVKVLEKAGWTKTLGKQEEKKEEKKVEKPVVKKVEPQKVEIVTATSKSTPKATNSK